MEGSDGFAVQFWLANLGSEEPLVFEAVHSSKFSLKCLCIVAGFLGLEGSGGFVVRFWLANLGSKGLEDQPLGFEAARSLLFLGSTQH